MILGNFDQPPKQSPKQPQTDHPTSPSKQTIKSRNLARVLAMQYLFQNDINPVNLLGWLSEPQRQSQTTMADLELTHQLIAACEDINALDEIYKPFLSKSLYHVGAVEKAILRLAIAELKLQVTSATVVTDEAIKMAKTFGSSDGFKLINAVIDAYVKSDQHQSTH